MSIAFFDRAGFDAVEREWEIVFERESTGIGVDRPEEVEGKRDSDGLELNMSGCETSSHPKNAMMDAISGGRVFEDVVRGDAKYSASPAPGCALAEARCITVCAALTEDVITRT